MNLSKVDDNADDGVTPIPAADQYGADYIEFNLPATPAGFKPDPLAPFSRTVLGVDYAVTALVSPADLGRPGSGLKSVLDSAGASLERDEIDQKIKTQWSAGRLGGDDDPGDHSIGDGLIDDPSEVIPSGWPDLTVDKLPDEDNDGIEDAKDKFPKDPRNASLDDDGDGWTNLEEYLDELTH